MTAPQHGIDVTSAAPTPNHGLSPYTGYTRGHWESAADRLLAGLVPHASPGWAQYRLPGRTGYAGAWSDGLEGYARSFMLAAFRIAGAKGQDAAGSNMISGLIERYAAGLAAGTDPAHPEHWPPITDRSQSMVEAASIAVALHETRQWLWEHLDERVRHNTAIWLGGFVGATTNDSNWRLFQVIVEEFLASIDAPHSRAEIDAGLARLDDWYRGDGWYTDGDGQKFDYYNALALHLYPALWARIAGPRADAGLVAVHRERLRAFVDVHQHFFGSDGAPVHQGRSLTYRYATAAPLWVAALADANPLSPGRTRRLASGALKHFADRGVPGEDGVLTLGWYRPYLPVTQAYSGPASPYWASKAFLGLLLDADHPVWTAKEEPAPVDRSDQVVSLPAPGWLLQSTAGDGIVRLVNHGSDRQPPPPSTLPESPHYTRFAYSSATAPQTPPDDVPAVADNHIWAEAAADIATRRGRIHPLYCQGDRAASWHSASTLADHTDAVISTMSVVHGPWEIRVHRVETEDAVTIRESGWAVADEQPMVAGETGDGWALARRPDGLTTVVAGLLGWESTEHLGAARVVRDEGLNAFGQHSAVPLLTTSAVGVRMLVTLVVLTRDPNIRHDAQALHHGARAEIGKGQELVLTFPDGARRHVSADLLTLSEGGNAPPA
ncbi:DUF2264 domain-containing protein [Streptomyces sp. SID8379]|uniref:DUF2264 domain-containing protein n=1 Tax=unclassified Streptomyces TaxID=2593676 RepID=UPI0003612DBC|nr:MULTISPECIES: DUF2264 domain-containing protein [unclassified Streptomyces]MYW70424.1 DUF2264 domain-containing protein [Streptomyces sp. SID8379]